MQWPSNLRPVDSNQLTIERIMGSGSTIDTTGLSDEVRIEGTDDDSGMLPGGVVQRDEVLAVDRQNSPFIGRRVYQHLLVGQLAIRVAGFLNGDNVVAKTAELLNDRQWEVLVGVESGHDLRGLVHLDLPLDVAPMGAIVGPRICEIFGSKSRVAAQ